MGFLVARNNDKTQQTMQRELPMKKLATLCALLLLSVLLVGCGVYRGEHRDLHAVAINSLLGIFGCPEDVVRVIETDEYGRTLFAFRRASNEGVSEADHVLALLISQKSTSEHAYFYDGYNVIFCMFDGSERWGRLSPETVFNHFSVEEVERLKADNDWGKEINEDRLFRIPIRGYKPDTVSIRKQRAAFGEVSDYPTYFRTSFSGPLTTDKNGKTLYLLAGFTSDAKAGIRFFTPPVLAMFDKDGNLIEDTGLKEITDIWDYRDELREFKESNNWSFYYR